MSESTPVPTGIAPSPTDGQSSAPAAVDLPASWERTSHGAGTTSPDYRDDLGSRRWNAAPLRNPEVEKTDPRIALAAILILAAITLVVLVAGYAIGFWQLPGSEAASGAVAALELLA
jgi:hypothetical protein